MNMAQNKDTGEKALDFKAMKRRWFLRNYGTEVMMLVVLVVGSIAVSIATPYFFTPGNLLNVCSQISTTAIMAIGMTLVIITGGIDLSIGTLLGFSGMLAAMDLRRSGNIGLALLIALGMGLLIGVINGYLIGYVKLPAFIVTLGTQKICSSMNYVITNGMSASKFPEAFSFLGKGKVLGGIPFYLILIVILFALFIFILQKVRFGRFLYATGSNEDAARLSGIHTNKIIMTTYVISGLMAALAGLIMISRLMACDPTYGKDAEMDVIAGVVIGGTSMAGGKGTLWGTLVGVIIVGVLRNALNLLGVNTFWQGTAIGAVIIVAVLAEQLSHRKKH